MIGYYNYTVILTYISLISAVGGMMFTVNGHFRLALVCLAFSGLCDMFDGKVARRKKDRTEEEKRFGIQIDSLCDMVCFGAFPVLWAYCMGMNKPLGILILMMYAVNGVIRLGYFNVMEEKRQQETDEVRKYYSGLPITSIAIVLPVISMVSFLCRKQEGILLHITMLIVGILFVTKIRVPKPRNITLGIFVLIVGIALLKIFRIF